MRQDQYTGTEFDWVAVDEEGNLAAFSTSGYGPVPPLAMERASDQDTIIECIKTATGIPTHVDLLTLQTECPIYIFDWKLHDGPYLLVNRPTGGKTPALNLVTDNLHAAVTRMALNFSSCDSISHSSIPTQGEQGMAGQPALSISTS